MRTRPGVTLVELMVVIVILGVVAALLVPIFVRSRRTTYCGVRCSRNLRQIGAAMMMYADNPANGGWPNAGNNDPMKSMSLLYKEYINDPRVFHCPQDKRRSMAEVYKITPVKTGKLPVDGVYLSKTSCSYGYDPAAKTNESRQALAADMPGNHGIGTGRNVLFVGGQVEWRDSAVNRVGEDEAEKSLIDPDIFAPNPELPREVDSHIRQ